MKFIIIVERGIRVEAKTQGRRPPVVAWLLGKKGRVNSPAQVRQFAQTITTFKRYQKCRNVSRLAQSVKKHWLEAEWVQGLKGYQPYERSHTPQKGWWGSECVNDKGYFFVKWKFYLCENLIDVFLCFMGKYMPIQSWFAEIFYYIYVSFLKVFSHFNRLSQYNEAWKLCKMIVQQWN